MTLLFFYLLFKILQLSQTDENRESLCQGATTIRRIGLYQTQKSGGHKRKEIKSRHCHTYTFGVSFYCLRKSQYRVDKINNAPMCLTPSLTLIDNVRTHE